jgi:hypothetical protein
MRAVGRSTYRIAVGFSLGALLGAIIYRINGRKVLEQIDDLVVADKGSDDFPRVLLRLHGPSLGLAIGAVGALGLVITTNMLVIRGTARRKATERASWPRSCPATPSALWAALSGTELFALLYVFFLAFAYIYNRLADRRQPR